MSYDFLLNPDTMEELKRVIADWEPDYPPTDVAVLGHPICMELPPVAGFTNNSQPLQFGKLYELGSPMLPFPRYMLNLLYDTTVEALLEKRFGNEKSRQQSKIV